MANTPLDMPGALAGTFAPGVGVITPMTAPDNPGEPIVMALVCSAVLTFDIMPAVPDTQPRALPTVTVAMNPPVVVRGIPTQPAYLSSPQATFSCIEGIGHTRTFGDPDPVWGGSGWTVAPPSAPAGSHFVRWTARDLPNPTGYALSGQPANEYPLGTPTSADGTSGITAAAQQWNASAGSDYAIPWQSKWPFKPRVQPYLYRGPRGSVVSIPACVRFSADYVQHLWADFGTMLNPPFTVVIVAVLEAFSAVRPWQYVLDSGEDPTPYLSAAQLAAIAASGVSDSIAIPNERTELGYRTGIRVSTSRLEGYTDENPTTRIARASYANTYRPVMLYGSFTGAHSVFGIYYHSGTATRFSAGSANLVNYGAQRFAILGRANGMLANNAASSMAVFEIRVWDQALDDVQMRAQYDQLSSTWQFTQFQ